MTPTAYKGHRMSCEHCANAVTGELTRSRLLDEDTELLRAHLHSLPEIVADDHAPLFRGVVINNQLRAAAVTIAAQHGKLSEPSGFFLRCRFSSC